MVFRFTEEGGFNTEDGLFKEASGVFSKVSSKSDDDNFLFLASGVPTIGIFIGLEELVWFTTSSEEFELSGPFAESANSPFIKSFLHSALGIAVTLLRMEDGDLLLEQELFCMFHNRT